MMTLSRWVGIWSRRFQSRCFLVLRTLNNVPNTIPRYRCIEEPLVSMCQMTSKSCLTHPRFGGGRCHPVLTPAHPIKCEASQKQRCSLPGRIRSKLQSLMTAFHLVLAPSRLRMGRRRLKSKNRSSSFWRLEGLFFTYGAGLGS